MSKAPGTIGTLGAIPLVWTLGQFDPIVYMIFTFTLAVVAIFVSHLYLSLFDVEHDPGEVVIDEVVGFMVAMTWLPHSWQWLALGFILFRFLDILKPFPIGYVDRKIEGGVGVVADDLVAGILANVILQIVLAQGWL